MKKLLIAVCALVMLTSHAFAWNYSDFNAFDDGTSPFDHNNNWSPIDYPNGVGNLPSPGLLGEGGESFDLEGLQVRQDENYVYVALANSFGYSAYSSGWGESYELGDLFIGTSTNKYMYGIDIVDGVSGVTSLYQVNGAWNDISASTAAGTYASYSSIREQAGAWKLDMQSNDLEHVGNVDFQRGFGQGYETAFGPLASDGGDTYVWEFRMDRALFAGYENLHFHIALECGNDVINENFSAVPEPATMILFGLGLTGAALLRRRRKS